MSAAAAPGTQELHTLAQTLGAKGLLFHTIRHPSGSWTPFGDVEGQASDAGLVLSVAAAGVEVP